MHGYEWPINCTRTRMQGDWAGRDFSIWGAGRDGRQFLAALQPAYRARVRGFCDIDPRKIARGYVHTAPPRPPYIRYSCLHRGRWRARVNGILANTPRYIECQWFYEGLLALHAHISNESKMYGGFVFRR